jgi:N12 class adenine-specific DNA methylase
LEDAGTEYLPALSKDALAKVALTDFFSLDFSRSVNHRRGVDGSDQRGQKQKARDNLQAIRILKTCVAENRAPSTEEQQKIALFYGFGGLPYSFRRPNGQITSGWSDVVLELEALTTDAELKSLRARTVDAQYTSDAVVSAIWDTVRQALPKTLPNPQDLLQVLEPSVGSGVFLSLAPDVPMEFLAVEMDPITATVAKALHPREKIYNAPFQKVQFPETVDVVVGNPPFGKGKLLDMDRPDLTRVSPNTHGYFFAKSMDRLRPGGLAILVVSRYLMDADMPEHRAFRVWLHNQAELVSAVRLPHTVFSKTAFTDVVCDVVALRKRDHPLDVIYEPPTRKMVEDWTKARKKEIKEREERTARPEELIYPLPDHLPAWIRGKAIIAMGPNEKGEEGVEPVLGNPWYLEHPDHVLGELSIGWGKGLYRAGAPIVLPLPEFEDIGASLARVLKSDVQPGMLERLDRSVQTADPEYPVLSAEDMGRHTTPYSYFIVPETARKAALDIWEQIETIVPNPDGRIPAPVASRLFTTEDQPLIGMRVPDRVDCRTREKKTQWRLVTFAPTKAANDIQRLTGMIGLRDTLLDLLNLQRTEERRQTPEMQSLRRKLRQDYDRFVKRYHHLHRPVNESLMRNDPSWAMLSGLEIEYTPEVSLDKSRKTGLPRSPEQVVLSEIFERRTQYPIQPVEHVDSAVDAMMVSLSESGKVDPARLQSLTGKSLAAIQKELKIRREDALAFIAPDGRWYERSQWLSGNIDEKIRMIRAAQERDGGDSWTWDIAMLEAHRPPRISILDRTIHIGAFWLPQDVVSDFVTHLGGIQPMIHKNPISGEWAIKCDGRPPEYSTDDMSLQDLLMALHNRRTIQVTRHIDNKTVVDAEATSLAVEKADRIKDAWRDWIYADTDRVRLMEDRYNNLMNTYRPREYDGRHLNLPGSNPEIRLRPHQKNAVWRMTQSKSTLLDHVVGAGKTFAAIAGVMEKRRTGQSRKPLVTVPNHLVGQWAKDWLRLYPDARLLVADKEDMAGSNRQVFLAKAAFNDVDAVIVAHSSFDRIPIDAEFYEEYLNREIDQAEDFLRGKLSMEGLSVKRMEKKIQETRTRVERLHAQANESRDQGCLNFSEIGFDLLVVDESHNYKNVPYNTSLQNVRGLGNPAGSIKAENMMIKVTQCRDGGSGVVFLTGTPISNTVAEMYLLQKYMAPEKLEEKGIHTFDVWVSLFAEVQEEFAFTLTGSFKNLRTLATFDNLPELVGMYRDYADVINQKDIAQLLKEQRQHAIPMPKIKGGKAEIVVCPMTPAQRRIIGEEVGYREDTGEPEYAEGSILWRLDHLPSRPGPGEDNVLVIISDLRKAGLDARAFDPSYVPEEGEETGKLGICAENVKRVYDEWNEDRGTQLVYLDFSTPSKRNRQEQNALEKQLAKIVAGESPDATDKEKQAAESALEKLLEKYTNDEIQEARAQWLGGESATPSFVAYEALRNRMVALGIPRDEIAFIHDADTDEKKEELFDAVRSGKVRVMIGSTPKMGPGMNVQDRLVYVHHLDAPYRPTDVEQRNGRIIRQGNLLLKKYGKSFRVGIAYYVTENSSDAGLWQILETKKKFIDQVRYYDGKSNTVSDPDAQAIDPAAIKAQASGHEVLMLEVPLRARVKRLQALKNGYREEIHRAQGRAVTAREKMVELQGFVLPRAPEVAAQIRTLQETLKTGGSLAGGSLAGARPADGSLAGGSTAVDDSADILSIDKKEDPAFIPWGQGSHERMVTKKFLMDKFNKAMRELNGQSVSAHERVGFIGGFVVELEQLFTAGAMTIELYPPDARHVHALHISSTKFDPEKNVNFFSRLENMLDASALETSIRNKEQEYRNAIRLGESDQVFGQENELQTLQQQHQLASRLLRLKVRKLDDLEERLTGVFLQNVKKTLQDVQETNPDTGETIMVSRLMHSREEERDARHQAKTFVQEMIEAFSRPPLTENALMVLEKLGVSAKKREALRESLGLSAEDAMSQAETENANAEEEEDEIEVVEEKPLTETAVDETVLKSRIGIRETVEAENPWLSASAPFLPDLSAPGNGVQVSLFDDLFAPETPAQAAKPSTPSDRLPNDLPSADLPSADLQSADLQSVEMRAVKTHPAEAPSAREEVTAAQEIKTEAVMEDMEKSSIPAPSNAPRIEDAILDYITQSYDFVVYLAKHESSEENLGRYGIWKEAVKNALRELTGAGAAFAGYDTGTVDMGYLVHHFYLRHHAAPEISVATPMANRTPDATDHPIQSTPVPVPVLRTIPPTLREFLPQSQYMATEQGLRGEEREYFSDKMRELEQVIRNMPQTYQTEGQGDNAPVTLHYFRGNADWYIIEKDSDPNKEGQIQAFGLADLGMGEPELGYINIQELVRAGVEMDYHFAPRTLRELKLEKYPEMVRDDAPENAPAPKIEPASVPTEPQARIQTIFYNSVQSPDKIGETVEQMLDHWNDSGIAAHADHPIVAPYLQMPARTGSLRVLYTQKPDDYPVAGWSAVEYKEPVILAELPDHAVLVAEQSYLNAYQATQHPDQNAATRAMDQLAEWITPAQMTALRNVMNDSNTDMPYTVRHLETLADMLRDQVQPGPRNLPIPTPKTAEILAGAGRGILTYHSPDSLRWWFITGMDQSSGHLYGLQMVRSRPDSQWEAQMGPVARKDLLDAGFLMDLAPVEPFVAADRMREIAPYLDGVEALPADLPVSASSGKTPDQKIVKQTVFDAGIPATGQTIGDLLGNLREHGLNLVAPSNVIDQYFYMERGKSVRVAYSHSIGRRVEPLQYDDPVTLATGPNGLILVAERTELEAYLALNPQRSEVSGLPASTLNIPERLRAMATPEQQSEWRALAGDDDESRELLQVQLNRLDMGLRNLPAVGAAKRLRLDGRAGLVLRSESQEVRWLVTGMDANGRDAFGLRMTDETTATLGRVDLRIALMDAPILEIDHEDGPLRADLRESIVLIESVTYADDPRAIFWRGGPEGVTPQVQRIEDILDYERNTLGNADVQFAQEGLEYLNLPPVRSLQWLTLTEDAAREYGEPRPVVLVDPVFLARNAHDGVLVAERAGLEQMALARRLEQSPIDAAESATAEYPEIPAFVARFMGDRQKTLLTTMLNSTDQNTKSILSPNKTRDQLNRLDRWLSAGSATTMQKAQAKGLNAVGQMALRMQNGDRIFMSALSEDGTSGYGLTLQTMTHRAALETLDLSIFDRDNWTVDLTHEPQPLRVTLADHGYSREAVTIERMTTNAIPASMPERGRIEKAGLSELSQEGPTYQSAIEAIESAGGWDAVADSPALQKSLQDQLDHLIQTRAEQVSQVLQEDGWKWSGAAFFKDDEGFKIFPNGRSSGGNMVHWGYRITRRDGDTPVAIDVDDEMTLTAQDLVGSMLDQIRSPVAHTSAIPTEANPSTPDGELSPEIQNHLNILRPFIPENQFHAILGVLSGESGLEAAQSEASHIARLAQWIDHQGITYPDGRSGNGGHPLPDDAAVQGASATCVLAYTKNGYPDTFLTGMDDLGNLYGVRIRVGKAIAGPLDLAEILNDRVLQITMPPAPVAELLDGYRPEGVTHEPPVTYLHEPYRLAVQRNLSRSEVQGVLNAAVAAMPDGWTANAAKIKRVDDALFPLLPDDALRYATLENLKNAEPTVEANRHAEAVRAGLADPEDASAPEAPEAPEIPATPLQQAMLFKIARSEHTSINGAMPRNAGETETWADTIIETPQDKGVFTSLQNAGLVWHSGEKEDAGVGLTDTGFALYQAIEDAITNGTLTLDEKSQIRTDVIATPDKKPDVSKTWLAGLTGALGAGKDTVADMLVAQGGNAVKVGFGDILYREVSSAYGIPVEWLENRKMKDSPQSALSRAMCQNEEMQEVLKNKNYTAPLSPRYVLQQWGDCRRSQNPDYLIDHVRKQVQSALDSGSSVAVSGMRTMPELTMIREMGGVTLRVRHPEVEQALEQARVHGSAEANHYLENSLNDVPMDLEIVNDGTLDELQAKIPELYAQILKSLPASPSAALQTADLPSAGLSSATLPSVGLPSAGQSSARPFGLGDPIARAMLERIEASPYSLSYLLGDDRARDVDDPPYAEDAEWHAARVQFADEIDAVLNGRIRQNVDALGEHGWMQPVLHGDLIRGGVVIHLDTVQDADDNMQELIYRVSLAADTEGNETRTVRDYLRISSAQFANELHGIAEQIRQKLEQDTRAYPEFTQKILDDYVVAHIHEHAPMVAQQAKANALEHFLLGNVLSATSNAILDAIEDNTLPRAVRDAAKAVLQGTEGMTDYRARIGRMVFDEEQSLRPGVPDVTVPADGPVSVVEIPLGRSVQPNDWLPMTDAQLGFRYRTENGVRELVFGTSRGDETILALHQDRMRLFHPVKNLQDPVMQRVILPLLADQLPEWETALHDAGVSLREIALPSDEDITQRLALWKQKISEAESPQPKYPVIPLENAGDAVTGVLTGFADEGKQLLLQQDDGSTIAVEQPAIDDWRMVGIFNGKTWMEFQKGDEERAIQRLMRENTPIQLRIDINEGMGVGPVPVLRFAENGQFKDQAFVHRMKEVQANRRAADTAYSWLSEYYEKDGFAVVEKGKREAALFEDDAKVSIRYASQQNSGMSTDVSLQFTKEKDQIKTALKDFHDAYIWEEWQNLEKRGDMQLLIGTVEALRAESLKQQEMFKKQEPLVQAYLDSYAQAAERINAAIHAVDRSLVTDEQSARTIYQEVDKAVREGQGLIESAADALRKVSENGQISVRVNDRLGRYAPANQHREALMAVRTLNTELMQIIKDHLMEKGRDFLATANENTPIEEIAVAIFNKHGHNTTRTPDIVKYVQDHDLRQIQNTIGHNSMNSASQEIFEWMTGVQLGKTQKVRVRQIDAWAAVTPEMRARMDAEAKEQREEQQNIKDLRSIWESFAGMRMQRGGNGQDYILEMVGKGYTQVSSYKNGASVQYGLLNPEDHGVVYMTRNREFNRFCKTILKMGGDGGIMNALQKAKLIDGIQPPMPEPEPESDTEIEHLFSGAQSGPAAEAEPENAAAPVLPDLAPSSTAADQPSAGLPEQLPSDLLSSPEEADMHEDEDEDEKEDPDLAPVAAADKPELPGWKVGQPDMLSPLWDMQIPFTWPNEHGAFPSVYHAEWSYGKGYFEKLNIDIARDPQNRYHFSTSGATSSYAPNVNGPVFATFLEAHTAAREELAEKLRRKYAESTAEREFVKAAPKLLEGVTQRADGDRHSIAKTEDLLQEPPYQQAFGEILERLEENQRLVLTWGYRNDRDFNNWMVTLHQDDEEQSVMTELRTYGDWDFTQPPEFAQAVDLDNLDAWPNFLRQIAGRFPEKDRDALSLAPYGLHYEPIWHIAGPIPSERVSHLPPAPHWPEDVNDELPVEAPGEVKNFDRFIGLRFESESENQKQYVALFIARDKQGYVPAIGFQSKGVFGPSVPNARDTHYPSFVQAYEQGRKMLGKHIKEHSNLNWTTDADRAAKDWLDKKPEAAEPIFFGYDTARMETLWDRQDRLHDAIAVQIKHRKASSSIVTDEIDRYSLEAVIAGKSETLYLSSVSSLDRAMLMVNSAYALMQHQASQALDAKLEQPEALHRAETVVSHLKEEFGDLLTVAPEAKSPLRQQVESLIEDIEHKLEDVKRKEATAQSGSSLGQIMANKLSSLVAAQKLDALFGSDEAPGVRFVDHEGHEIPMTEDADGQSVFPDGSSATICTDYAEQIRKKLEGHEVQIVGLANENNPDCAVVREAWHPGGHDFAIVDHRWLIDPWARLVGAYREQIVYDLRDPEDTRKVAEIYGDPLKWDRSGTYSIGHASSLTLWDRSGLEGVIEVVEANERKAAGITITEAAIIPTRAGVVAVPTDPNLPVYHAGQSETPVESPSAGTKTTDESWLSEIPEAYRMTVRAVATPFMELSAQVKYAELTAVRAGHRMLNMELEGPEFWRNGQILLHAKIDDDTHHVVEREWSLSISREVMNNVQLYVMFTQIRDRGLLDDLRSVDRIKADYGPVLMNGVLGRTEIAEIMACHGLQPLRLLLTVEPDGMPNETLNRLTNHLMDRLRGWRTDFQNTPVVIDILSIQGFPETMMDRLRMVAESVDRADTTHPESLVRRADLTAQIGMTCDAVASILGHNFRSQQYRDLVKPLLIYQPDIIEVRLEKMLPDVLNTLYQRNETNHRQMDLQGLVPLSKTLDAIALQVPEAQTQPQKVEVSAQPEDPRQFQASILDEAPAESTGTEMPSAGQDADWQRLKDLPVTLPEIMDASMDQQPLLDRLARRGIPLGLLQEPSSVNYVTEILKSGDLAGAGAQAWSVRRNDLVAQDAELRELRFYNGDPEQRHVFLLVGNRFLFDPWMAMSKPGEPYALDIQNPADRDILIDRYLSPAFWISPHPAAVLSPAWRELERWNPDLQAFTDDSDDEMETPVELRETIILPAETITPSAETIAPLPETVATELEKVPDVPVPTPSIAGQGNPIAASPDAAGVQPHVGSSLAGDSPVGDSPAGSILAVRETAAPKVQEVLMDWKSLSETPEILPELAVYLRGLAEHPERLPESGRFWAQSVPQEVLREMLVSLSAEWDREYWKMTVDFLMKSLGGDPFVSRVDLLQHGTAKDAITGLSFLLMHLSASEAHWPGQELSVLDRDAFLKSLEKLPQAQGTPQEAATAPLPRSGEIGPDDHIVEIRIIPLDAAEQDWKVQNGQEPARWKLTAILQDGWEIPKVLKAGVTYAQALQAARDRTGKWGARLVDVYADARAGIVRNAPVDDLHLKPGEFTGTPEKGIPATDSPSSVAIWPASTPPSGFPGFGPSGQTPSAGPADDMAQRAAGMLPAVPQVAVLQTAEQTSNAGAPSAVPGFDIPKSIWKQEVTQPMNAEEQRVMEQVNAFLKDPGNIDETTKRQWIGQAIVVRNKTLEMMQPYFRRDPVLAAQWQQSDLLLDMVRKTMTINRENIAEIMQSPGNGVRRMLLQHLPVEPTLDAIRGWVLENAMTQMVTQTMNMDPFYSMMQVIRDRDFKFPHHALVDLSPPLVLFGPDRSARIILMRTPRSIPHMDSKDAITQIHACKSWVKSILDDKFDKEHLTIQMHIAYFDASRQNVLIRDVTEIPGQTDAVRKQAETVAKMVETKQVPKELPRVVNKVALTPEITRDVQEIARLEAMKQTLETQIQKMEQDLQSRMGGDPEAWPKIPQEVSMGSIRTEWSSRILDDKAMNALSTLGIPRSQVEKPEYDVDAMLRAMNNAGIATGQFITGHQLDTDRLNAVLQAYDVPRSTYQPARPVVTPNEKHPAYQQAVQTLQVNAPANSPAPTEEFTP